MLTLAGAGSTEFDTAIGRCGIAWQDDTIVAVRLPGTKRERQVIHPLPFNP